jgi:hypothetical protein
MSSENAAATIDPLLEIDPHRATGCWDRSPTRKISSRRRSGPAASAAAAEGKNVTFAALAGRTEYTGNNEARFRTCSSASARRCRTSGDRPRHCDSRFCLCQPKLKEVANYGGLRRPRHSQPSGLRQTVADLTYDLWYQAVSKMGARSRFFAINHRFRRVPIVDRPPYNHGLREEATSAPLKHASTRALFTTIVAGTPRDADHRLPRSSSFIPAVGAMTSSQRRL